MIVHAYIYIYNIYINRYNVLCNMSLHDTRAGSNRS